MRDFIYIFLFLLRPGVIESSDISCVAGETAVGCTAIVTCDFGRNIRDIKQTFMIFKYPTGTVNFDGDLRKDVMSCNWNSDRSLNCYVESPFVAHITSLQSILSNGVINYTKKTSGIFDHQSVVSDSSSIIVEISNVSKQHAGIYECQLVSSAYIPSKKCVLTVSDNPTSSAIQTSCDPATSRQETIVTGNRHEELVIALSILLTICIVTSMLILVSCVLRIRKGPSKPNVREALRIVFECRRFIADGLQPVERENTASISLLETAVETSRPLPVTCDRSTSCFVWSKDIWTQTSPNLKAMGTQTEDITKRTPTAGKPTTAQETVEKKPKEERPVEDWTAEDVQEWLTDIRMEPFQALFNRRVTGQQLLVVRDKKAVKDWGITDKRREELVKRINSLNSQNDTRKMQWKAEEEKLKEPDEEQQRELQRKTEVERLRQAADRKQREMQRKVGEENLRRLTEEYQREQQWSVEENLRRLTEECQREQQWSVEENLRRIKEECQREQQKKADEERLRRASEEQKRELRMITEESERLRRIAEEKPRELQRKADEERQRRVTEEQLREQKRKADAEEKLRQSAKDWQRRLQRGDIGVRPTQQVAAEQQRELPRISIDVQRRQQVAEEKQRIELQRKSIDLHIRQQVAEEQQRGQQSGADESSC